MTGPDIGLLPQNLLFDLDGTLLDSLPGIQHSVNAAFRACGLKASEADLRSLIGPPIRTIMQRMAPRELSREELDALENSFRWSYDSEGWKITPHYADAAKALEQLAGESRRLFVVSNKPQQISLRILEAEKTLGHFTDVITRDSRVPPYKDKLQMMQTLVQKWQLKAEDSLMVGDTIEDAKAAFEAGMPFCLMTHGYGNVPADSGMPVTYRLDSFAQLLEGLRLDR